MTLSAEEGPASSYTREQVMNALNEAASKVSATTSGESNRTVRDDDRANLLVNATGYLLDHPGGTLEDAIRASYSDMDNLCSWCEYNVYQVADGVWERVGMPDATQQERRYCSESEDGLHSGDDVVETVLGWVE